MNTPVDLPAPPTAEQRPYSYERHGVTIEDPWHWLRDPKYPEVDDPDVLAYLKAENAYFDGWTPQHQALNKPYPVASRRPLTIPLSLSSVTDGSAGSSNAVRQHRQSPVMTRAMRSCNDA